MIKIAFVIDTIYSPTGGTEKQLLLLLENLDRNRFLPVLCVLSSSEWLEKEFDLCPLHVIGIDSLKHPGALVRFWQFVRYLKGENFQIVHALFKDGMRIGIPAGRLAGAERIIAVRRSQGYWMSTFDLKVTRLLNRWVDLIIANSHNTRQWAAEVEGFPAERIEVIHNGLDLEPFSRITAGTRGDYRAVLSIPASAPVIGIVANLRPVKAIDVFLRAASHVKSAFAGAHFILVGDGDQEEGLKLLAEELGIADCTHFLGRRKDIHQILSVFDVGVLSSSSESFSNAIVEYLAAGLPVVCTDVGGAREAVQDGINGYVVPVNSPTELAQRISDILHNTEMLLSMKDASLNKARDNFSLLSMITNYQTIYSR